MYVICHHVNTSSCIKHAVCAGRNTRTVHNYARYLLIPSLSLIKSPLVLLHKISLVVGTAGHGRHPVRFADTSDYNVEAGRMRQSCFS